MAEFNRFHRLHAIVRWLPVSGAWKLRLAKSILNRQQTADLSAAKGDKERLQSVYQDWQHEWYSHDDDETAYYSDKLLNKARSLRVLIPARYGEDGKTTEDYDESQFTGRVHLTLAGENKVRAAIREEQKLRWEARARLVPFITALTGLAGTITGLIALLSKHSG